MCGILGVCGVDAHLARGWFSSALDTLEHRGPDDAGIWWSDDSRVGFGHRRLAIIDLSVGGHQPMHSVDPKASIVFNGEIYNFKELRKELQDLGWRFSTSSDTEVLLRAYSQWGYDCVDKLSGMFAFAIYDPSRGSVLLARDRAGEKPLYFHVKNRTICFASEVKALLRNPGIARRIDADSLDFYLAFGFSPSDHSLVREIQKLPPAGAMSFDLQTGQFKQWRYWTPPQGKVHGTRTRSPEDLTYELHQLLRESVRKQMVADVPLAVLLSGGLDSSIITALAAESTDSLRTFNVVQPDAPAFNEQKHARLIANHFGTRHVELEIRTPSVEILDKLAYHYDDPIADTSMIPTYLICQAVRTECTVAVGGDGGDELFGGYRRYNQQLRASERLGWLPILARQTGGRVIQMLGIKKRISQGTLRSLRSPFRFDEMPATYRLSRAERQALISLELGSLSAEQRISRHVCQEVHGLERLMRLDFSTYLPEDLLVKVDRASMANSLEVRAPLLAPEIIEFAYREVPNSLKATSSRRKILLKLLAKRLLPATFDFERKQGFSVPCAEWLMSTDWLNYVSNTLEEADEQIFDRTKLRQLLGQLQSHDKTVHANIMAIVFFERWRKQFHITA